MITANTDPHAATRTESYGAPLTTAKAAVILLHGRGASPEDILFLGHEIGHAVISNYFVVQPPIRIQEVLAGYVEYQLRKAAP